MVIHFSLLYTDVFYLSRQNAGKLGLRGDLLANPLTLITVEKYDGIRSSLNRHYVEIPRLTQKKMQGRYVLYIIIPD